MDLNTLLPKLVQRDFMKSIEHDDVKLDRYDILKLLNDNIEYKYNYFSFIGDYEIILSENGYMYYKVRPAATENIYLRVKALLDLNKQYGWQSEELNTVSGEVHPLYSSILTIIENNEKVPLDIINEFLDLRFSEPEWDVLQYFRQLSLKGLRVSYREYPKFSDFVSYFQPLLCILHDYLKNT